MPDTPENSGRSWFSRWLIHQAILWGGYLLIVRPALLSWGADNALRDGTLAGDDLIPQAGSISTRAIEIAAPPGAIWPWLVQIGQGRGGFYSYDRLENLFGLDIHSADRIIPELQSLQEGDTIRLDPTGSGTLRVAQLEPEQVLVLRAFDPVREAPPDPTAAFYFDFSWAFVLQPLANSHTRLVIRGRYGYAPRSLGLLVGLMEPVASLMEAGMLRGIKARAERYTSA